MGVVCVGGVGGGGGGYCRVGWKGSEVIRGMLPENKQPKPTITKMCPDRI